MRFYELFMECIIILIIPIEYMEGNSNAQLSLQTNYMPPTDTKSSYRILDQKG